MRKKNALNGPRIQLTSGWRARRVAFTRHRYFSGHCGLFALLTVLLFVLVVADPAPAIGGSTVLARAIAHDAPATILAIPTTTPQSQPSNSDYYFSPLEVRVLDSAGNPVGGVTVTFTSLSSGPSASLGDGNSEQQVTNAQGLATLSDAGANNTIGSYEVSAAANGVSAPAVFYLTNTDGTPDTLNPVLSTTPQSTTVGTAFARPLQATLIDSTGNPAAGVAVTFTTFTGLESGLSGQADATFTGGVTTVSEFTNADGVATAPSLTANSAPGAFVVTASVTEAYDPAVFDMTATETTTTVLKLTAFRLTYGHEQTERLSVMVSPEFAGSTPTGTVTVKTSTTTLCTIRLSSSRGSCTLAAKRLNAGSYHIVAIYGNTNFRGSTSAKLSLTVVPATSRTVIRLSTPKLIYGHERTEHFSVTVEPEYSGSAPTGTVRVKDSKGILCVIALSDSRGSCRPAASKLPVGASSLVATYGGNADFDASVSTKKTIMVVR